MLETEESSSDTDADWKKLESKNPFLKLMALSRARNTMSQYLNQDIDGLDVKLLFGIYQKKVLGYEERVEEVPDILEKIILAKKIARQIYKQKPSSEVQVDEVEPNDKETPYESPIEEIEKPKLEKHAKNSPRL